VCERERVSERMSTLVVLDISRNGGLVDTIGILFALALNSPSASMSSATSATVTATAVCCMWSADYQNVRVFDRCFTCAFRLGSCDRGSTAVRHKAPAPCALSWSKGDFVTVFDCREHVDVKVRK
jgi:hypothetical protein